jgi:hypothetical protein
MFGNFNEANRQNGGQTLDVRGWLVWEATDPPNASAQLTITVNQNGASGTKTVTVTRPATTWQAVPVNSNGQPFVQGRGIGTAATPNGGWTANPLNIK